MTSCITRLIRAPLRCWPGWLGLDPRWSSGIGTGRIALPLQAAGVEVHGVDSSPAMVERLRVKPGGERIPITIGSFTDLPVEGRFSLVFVVFNTIFVLLTQDDQLRCFANAARRLTLAGRSSLRHSSPELARYDSSKRYERHL